jgi:cbb3-type cytochrome oxidase maturation protein
MTGLLILIPAALFLGAVGLLAFLWSLRSGQFDDLDGAAVRILEDNVSAEPVVSAKAKTTWSAAWPADTAIPDASTTNRLR